MQRLHDALKRVQAVKPVLTDLMQDIVTPARSHIPVSERGRVSLVQVDKILFMRAEQKYVCLKTLEREHLLEESLSRLEQEFSDSFVRVHRNCLVSRAHILSFEREGAMGDGQWPVRLRGLEAALPVSRRQQHVIKQLAA
ncbi:MAG: LytTR family transcriptional regulator [Betaproteobacteria bacterium]|nr:LytTR family transcriptional regulator [Betaproteobacteria bacterium]